MNGQTFTLLYKYNIDILAPVGEKKKMLCK
jgi:hypothetical protein